MLNSPPHTPQSLSATELLAQHQYHQAQWIYTEWGRQSEFHFYDKVWKSKDTLLLIIGIRWQPAIHGGFALVLVLTSLREERISHALSLALLVLTEQRTPNLFHMVLREGREDGETSAYCSK